MKKPTNILDEIISYILITNDTKRRYPNPGQMITRLPPKTREILSGLKSDDICNANFIYDDEDTSQNKDLSKLLLEFDKKSYIFVSN